MCTISFVPAGNKYIFTFNRDEQVTRTTPDYLAFKDLGFKKIFFPRDGKAGGTWFAADDKGNVALLFNGALKKHEKKRSYVMSRGLILLDLVSSTSMLDYFRKSDFTGVEPFSIILFEEKKLYRLYWDETHAHIVPLHVNKHHIFSSATLYPEHIQNLRRCWLDDFLQGSNQINEETIYTFHRMHMPHDKENGLVIERMDAAHTLSISQAIVMEDTTLVKHWDLLTHAFHEQTTGAHEYTL